MRILMEVQPTGVDTDAIRREILTYDGVEKVTDIHTFALAGQKNVLSVHILIKEDGDMNLA